MPSRKKSHKPAKNRKQKSKLTRKQKSSRKQKSPKKQKSSRKQKSPTKKRKQRKPNRTQGSRPSKTYSRSVAVREFVLVVSAPRVSTGNPLIDDPDSDGPGGF